MNERIKEIYKEARRIPYMSDNFMEEWEFKFAELLIRECLFIIDDERKPDTVNRTELWKQIKQHFGVEE